MLSTGEPGYAGEKLSVDGHELVGRRGHLPINDIVWECQLCDKRYTSAEYFDGEKCQ